MKYTKDKNHVLWEIHIWEISVHVLVAASECMQFDFQRNAFYGARVSLSINGY